MLSFSGGRQKVGFIDFGPAAPGSRQAGQDDSPRPEATLHLFVPAASGYSYEGSRRFEPDEPDAIASVIRGVADFRVSVPLADLDFRLLSLPFSDRKKIGKVLPFELDPLVSGGSGGTVFDSVVLGGSGGKSDVLAVYMKKSRLQAILEKLASAGMDPRVVGSVELRAALDGSAESLADRLADPGSLSDEARLKYVREELSSPAVNLRTGQYAYTGDIQKTGRAVSVAMVLMLLILLVLHGDLWVRYFHSQAKASQAKARMRSLYAGLFPDDRKIVDELYQMKSRHKELKDKADTILGAAPLDLLLLLSGEKAEGIIFNEVNVEKGLITMKGEAGSTESAGRLRESLSGRLPGVSLADVKRSADGKTLFTLVAKVEE